MKQIVIGFLGAAAVFTSGAISAQGQAARPQIGVSPPSILKQCLDPGTPSMFVGPSARARECTRQYCSQPSYRAKVRVYAMSQPQSELEAEQALTCITRWEQDQKQS
ncbi:hypothetical protein ACFOLC_16050 [Lysobacter cavernae]|uniref:Uncharacterized protein n=1 Tax=Lysobacter cavernae TaxID=1685901 RepID=A0ABV7RTQ2_9GAMM